MTREEFQFSQVIVTLFIMIYMSGSGRVCFKTDPLDPYRQPVPITQQRGSQNREKVQNGGKQCCFAFQRLFQSSLTAFSLFLLRQGHSPHIFQTPHCYQISFHGQLLAHSVVSTTLHCPCCYSDSTSLHHSAFRSSLKL